MPLILLDRDGVLNEDLPSGVCSVEALEVFPHAARAVALLTRAGCKNVIVTNQSNIGRGVISETTLSQIHQKLCAMLTSEGGAIDDIFFCPDVPASQSYRRKPKPGMLLEAMQKYGAQKHETYMIGDAITDMQAAYAAGVHFCLVRTGKGRDISAFGGEMPRLVAEDVEDAAHKILAVL